MSKLLAYDLIKADRVVLPEVAGTVGRSRRISVVASAPRLAVEVEDPPTVRELGIEFQVPDVERLKAPRPIRYL